MASKGRSNKYNFRNSDTIGYAYANNFKSAASKQHYQRHGGDFNCSSMKEYQAKGMHFANLIDKNFRAFKTKDKTYKYDEKTNTLVIVSNDGSVETFFKPKEGKKYYENQKQNKSIKKRKTKK